MSRIASHPLYGFRHESGRFGPELMHDLEAELANIVTNNSQDFLGRWEWRGPETSATGTGGSLRIPQLRKLGGPATQSVLDSLITPDDYQVNINYQPSGSAQPFHRDANIFPGVAVVHASDGGRFDVSLEHNSRDQYRAEADHRSIKLGAGDVVVQYKPDLLHRGVNPSNKERYNLVIFRPRPKRVFQKTI